MRRLRLLPLTLVCTGLAGVPAMGQQRRPAVFAAGWPGVQREMAQYLVDAGVEVAFGDIGAQDLSRFNAILLISGGASGPTLDTVLEYVRGGGGLFIDSAKWQTMDDFPPQFALLDRLGARLLPETVTDPATQRPATSWYVNFALTRAIAPSPVSEGVKQLWYPVGGDLGSMSTTMTYELSDDWQVVVRGSETSRSDPFDYGAAMPAERTRPKGYDSSVPFYAIRSYGGGRIALCGINPSFLWSGGFAPAIGGVVLASGIGGEPSDAGRLLVNTLRWLAQPSLESGKLGGATTPARLLEPPEKLEPAPRIDWDGLRFGEPMPAFEGIVGARTSLSVGRGTVSDYVAAAKAAGFKWIAFLEDFNELSADEWETLRKECNAASDDAFAAIPGFTIEDVFGDHYFSLGTEVKYPEPDLLTPDGKQLTDVCPQGGVPGPGNLGMALLQWNYVRMSFTETFGPYLTAANVIPAYCVRTNDAIGLVTQQDGEGPDDCWPLYLYLTNRGEHLQPLAVTLLDSPDDMERVASSEYSRTIVEAGNLRDLRSLLSSHYSAMPPFDNVYQVTNGPRIREWRYVGPRDHNTWEWFRYDYDRWRLRLAAESDVGLAEVAIFDGEETFRRFLPGGAKRFEWESDLNHGQQKNLTVRVTDTRGRRSVSSELYDRTHLLEEFMCSDRMNQLSYTRLRRPDGSECRAGFVWGMTPNKGPWNAELAPVGTYKPDARLGGAVPGFDGAPGGDPLFRISPDVASDQGYEAMWRTRMRTDRVMTSADAMIGGGRSDGLYAEGMEITNVWHTMAPTTPTKLMDAEVRRTYFNVTPDALAPMLGEVRATIKQPLKASYLGVGYFDLSGAACWVIRDGDDVTKGDWTGAEGQPPRTGTLEGGDYLAFCDSPLGSVAIFNLGEPLEYGAPVGRRERWTVSWPVAGQQIEAGRTLAATILAVGAPMTAARQAAWAEEFRERMGLAGDPAYSVQPEHGKVVSRRYWLRIDGQGEGFAGRISQADLPARLPILVDNLNPLCSVGLLDRAAKLYRPLGKVGGTAYATIDTTAGESDLFIGHPLVADDPRLVLCVTQVAESAFSVEVHNPTDAAITAQLRSPKGFTVLNVPPTKVTVLPGSSVWFAAGPSGLAARAG